ncbi:MAG: radical SAM protein [Candidatus Sumerlaeota bacterium]|nr:radical SAM protein [Candidatus Sumerlaeota bacterium]
MEDIRIDSHKMMYHPDRVASWLRDGTATPIYMEISPSGACNHRCKFCAKDFVGYKPTYLDGSRLASFLQEMAKAGLRSVMFAGEGEPCLNRDIAHMVRDAKAANLDVAMTTNGSRLIEAGIPQIVDLFTWIRVSMNAGTPETYAKIHGVKETEFGRVLENLRALVKARNEHGDTTIGVQAILLPENENELAQQAEVVREIGVDYYTVKPFNYHPKSRNDPNGSYASWEPSDIEGLAIALGRLETEKFRVLFRSHAMDKVMGKRRTYRCCHALPFWAYLDSEGSLWACSTFLGDERFCYGNMNQQSFEQMWNGERKKALFADLEKNINVEECRWGCRMDEINQYLWELKHPGRHANFI